MKARSEADGIKKKLYFHTTSWAAAESIPLGGCMHEMGNRAQDFGQAFYLDHSWESAEEGARKRFEAEKPSKTAILVYAVEASALNGLKYQTFPLFGEDDVRQHVPEYMDWQRNVFLSRKGQKSSFRKYDLVTGPMLQNAPEFVQYGNEKPAKPHPRYLQTGLKSFDACEAVSPCLVGIAISDPVPDEKVVTFRGTR